jgi:hypothetical protein
MASLQSFRGLISVDACNHAHYTLYNHTYFAGLIFADSRLSAKTAKIGPCENFPLYRIIGGELYCTCLPLSFPSFSLSPRFLSLSLS